MKDMKVILRALSFLLCVISFSVSLNAIAKEEAAGKNSNQDQAISGITDQSETGNEEGADLANIDEENIVDKETVENDIEQASAEKKPKKKLFGLPKILPPNKWFAKKKDKNDVEQEDQAELEAQTDEPSDDVGNITASEEGVVDESDLDEKNELGDTEVVNLDEAVNDQERIVQLYRSSSAKMARAQAQIAEAIGLKEEALLMRAEAEALESDSAKGQSKKLKSYTKTSKKTNKAISKRLEQKKELNQEEQEKFAKGMLLYAKGSVATTHFANEMRPFYASLLRQGKVSRGGSGIEGLFGKAKLLFDQSVSSLGTALYIARSSPKVIHGHSQTIAKLQSYAKNQNLDIPDDANEKLDGFSEDTDWKNV